MVKTQRIENRTFDEIPIGDETSLTRTLTWRDVEVFAAMSGDVNPADLDEEFAKSDMFHKIIAHGMWGGALISTLFGTALPGPDTMYVSQTLKFRRPIGLGNAVARTVRATPKDEGERRISFDCGVMNQGQPRAISGTVEVIAPTEKVCGERVPFLEVEFQEPSSNSGAAWALWRCARRLRHSGIRALGLTASLRR